MSPYTPPPTLTFPVPFPIHPIHLSLLPHPQHISYAPSQSPSLPTLYISPFLALNVSCIPHPKFPNMHTDQGSGLGGGSLRAPGTASEAGGADQPPDSFSVITDGVTRSALGDGSTMMVAGDGETPIGDALPRGRGGTDRRLTRLTRESGWTLRISANASSKSQQLLCPSILPSFLPFFLSSCPSFSFVVYWCDRSTLTLRARVRFPLSPGTFVLQQDTLSTLLLLTQMYKWDPVGCERFCGIVELACARLCATDRNAPQGVEKVHFECRIDSESYDG